MLNGYGVVDDSDGDVFEFRTLKEAKKHLATLKTGFIYKIVDGETGHIITSK